MIQILLDADLSLLFAGLNMALALALGAIIGTERQFRGRMAGLRTNALVSLGAAGFVVFAALFPDDINPTRVAAQVVSGIGFLGAGIIFRDGFNIQGINTAATLWCSAAVGLISGSGHILYAMTLTALIVFANLGLRPVVRRLKNAAAKNKREIEVFYLKFQCLHADEIDVRADLIKGLPEGLSLQQIASQSDKKTVEISARVSGHGTGKEAVRSNIEQVIANMSLAPRVLSASWTAAEDDEDA